jgi:hypothetical protein
VVAHTETWLVSDHPVYGAKVGFAEIFLDAAATPPHEYPITGRGQCNNRKEVGEYGFSENKVLTRLLP